MLTRIVQNWRQRLVAMALFSAAISLGACGGGDSGSGEAVIGLTDAQGDYASYTVDVQSLTLTRADGTVVETLPITTRVDFAQYTELTEFLTAATIPAGVYTSASMVLDYSNADIQVENDSGEIVPVTLNQDIDGNPIQTLEMSVQLEGHDKLVIAPGVPAHITLDFNLRASNSIEITPTDVIQTVSPFMVADVALEAPKPHRVRGPLQSVDTAAGQFNMILRPFYLPLTHDDHRFGIFTIDTSNDTVYEIDGVNYSGSDGLNQLASMTQYTAVVAIGELTRVNSKRVYLATQVYAGSSVPGGDLDVVGGHVLARSGNSLTLKGVTLIRKDGTIIVSNEMKVELADSTKVTKQLSTGLHTIGEISVGQTLTVFGNVSGDSASGYTLDASNGLARMQLTTLRGTVAQVDSPLALDLISIGNTSASIFDFSGTGVDPGNDADVNFYEINTAALSLGNINLNAPIKVRGFVRDYGLAPEDFDAQTLVKVADARAFMLVNWIPASASAFSGITDNSITLDLDGTGRFHYLSRDGELIDLKTLTADTVLVPNPSSSGAFVLIRPRSVQVYLDFTEFTRALSAQLDSQGVVREIQVAGQFSDVTATMTVRGMRVILR